MSIINEVDRAVIALPPDTTFYSSPVYLPIAFDAVGDQVTALLLTRGSSKSLNYLAAYELLGYLLCADRAKRAVDQQLVVKGQPVTPEAYLGMWRHAIKDAGSPADLHREHGLRLVAHIGGPVDRLAQYKTSWTSAPFQTLASTKYVQDLQVDGGRFKLRLELTQPNAARDAYYIAEMVANACRDDNSLWAASVELEGTPSATAPRDLFAGDHQLVGA